MSLSTNAVPAVAQALGRLIDYAGLFPPARLEMAPALDEYLQGRAGAHAWMLGRFIVPASRIGELRACLAGRGPIALSVIVDSGSDARSWFAATAQVFERLSALRPSAPEIAIEALELALPPLASGRDTYDATIGQCAALAQQYGLRDLPIFVELPSGARDVALLENALTALERYRLHAKLRCGGVVREAFPSVDEVATFIAACYEHKLAFKATAGLHHPIRHVQAETGFPMHGFLNLLAAATLAGELNEGELRAIVAQEDARAVALEADGLRIGVHRAGVSSIARARSGAFVAYGSCSFSEPVEDLTALGILAGA